MADLTAYTINDEQGSTYFSGPQTSKTDYNWQDTVDSQQGGGMSYGVQGGSGSSGGSSGGSTGDTFSSLGHTILQDSMDMQGQTSTMKLQAEKLDLERIAMEQAEKWRNKNFDYKSFMDRNDLEMREKQWVLNRMMAMEKMKDMNLDRIYRNYDFAQNIMSRQNQARIGNAMAAGFLGSISDTRGANNG